MEDLWKKNTKNHNKIKKARKIKKTRFSKSTIHY